jgi:hypothetical protein
LGHIAQRAHEDDTSLVKFRARLLLHGKERLVFERSLDLAAELGLLDGEVEQIVDSTPMLGAAAVQDTVTLVHARLRPLPGGVRGALRRHVHAAPASVARTTRRVEVTFDRQLVLAARLSTRGYDALER